MRTSRRPSPTTGRARQSKTGTTLGMIEIDGCGPGCERSEGSKSRVSVPPLGRCEVPPPRIVSKVHRRAVSLIEQNPSHEACRGHVALNSLRNEQCAFG